MPHTRPAPGDWTVEDMWALPDDGQRYEVIDGVLYVTPAPRLAHQRAVGWLHGRLAAYMDPASTGEVLQAPADLRLRAGSVVQPDVFVAPLVGGHRARDWTEIRRLLLAVEVLSPGSARHDRGEKRRLYQQHADEYWIVDLDGRVVERWWPDDERPEIIDQLLVWRPAGATAPLEISLPAFFAAALAD